MAMTPITESVRSQPRCRVVLSRGAAAAACALLAAACGSTAAPTASSAGSGTAGSGAASGSASASTAPASTASAAKISLEVSFAASTTAPARSYTLRCEPAGGTTPDAAAACGTLLTGTSIFAARPGHVMCPMILSSAGRATVTGTYLGKKVHLNIVDGGCDIGRWNKLKQIFN